MTYLKYLFELIFNLVTFPFYLITNIIPNAVDKFIYRYYIDRLQITRKNCWFLINPLSGKKIGFDVISILKQLYNKERILDLTQVDYVSKIIKFQEQFKDDFIYIVIGGGDGTQAAIINQFFQKSKNFKQLVFVPMPLGTGNDFSTSLGLMGNLGIDYLYKYFVLLNSQQLKPKLCDAWLYTIEQDGKKSEEIFLCYLGLGLEAQICYYFHKLRSKFPGLFFSRKTNKVLYSFVFFFCCLLNFFKSKNIKNQKRVKCKINGQEFDISPYQSMTVMNCYSRQGLFYQEWNQYPFLKSSQPQSMNDEQMELLTINNSFHLALITIFLKSIGKGAQGKEFIFEYEDSDTEYYCHLDGEPKVIKGPAKISLKFWNKINVLKLSN